MRRLATIILTLLFTYVVNAYDFNNRLASSSISLSFSALQSTPLPKTKHKLVVIAHRGSHLNVSENTLAAYANAIKEGADYVDVFMQVWYLKSFSPTK